MKLLNVQNDILMKLKEKNNYAFKYNYFFKKAIDNKSTA